MWSYPVQPETAPIGRRPRWPEPNPATPAKGPATANAPPVPTRNTSSRDESRPNDNALPPAPAALRHRLTLVLEQPVVQLRIPISLVPAVVAELGVAGELHFF